MRKLHLVGLTTDRDGLIFTARKGSKSGGYIVPLDDKVLDALAEAEAARNGSDYRPDGRAGEVDRRSRSESALTPREMQARLRAGRSIVEVAAEAGVDNEWVARFAVPILAEQAQVVELARGLTYAKPRLGESVQPLGASVVQNLSDKGVFLPDDLADAGWSAFQLHDSVWLVRFRYRSRNRDQEAQWELDVPAARLVARNRHASDLGYVEAGRRRRALEAEEVDAPEDSEPHSRPSTRAKAVTAAKAAKPATRTTATTRRRKALPAAKSATAKAAKPTKRATARAATASGGTRAGAPAPPVKAGRAPRPGSAVKAGRAGTAGSAGKSRAGTAGARPGTARRAVKVGPPVKAPAVVKGRGTVPPAGRGRTAKVPPAIKAGGAATAGTAKAGTAKAGTAKAGTAKAGTAKATTRRRPAKAGAAPEGGPAAGTGGVRLAVARVSTARVAASMASAERAPWAAAVRNRAGARPSPPPSPQAAWERSGDRQNNGRSSAGATDAGSGGDRDVPAFQPRPLPAGAQFDSPRARRPPPAKRARVAKGEPPPVVLPAPRVPAHEAVPIPTERPKRRRLRSR